MSLSLDGQVAIVTGAGRGVGRAEAIALAAHGAKVVVNDIGAPIAGLFNSLKDEHYDDTSPADEVVSTIVESGGTAVANYDDVSDFESASKIIRTALDEFGRIDILVNNAGNFPVGDFFEMSEAAWDSIIAVHLKGTFNTCRHAVPLMMKQGYGRIVNTASTLWRAPIGLAAYSAAKGGIVSLTWDLAWELANHGITVNAIAPIARTRAWNALYDPSVRSSDKVQDVPADEQERTGPEWVAPLVVYLSSSASSDVNGLVFRVGSGKVGIYSHPTEMRTIYRETKGQLPWSLDQLAALLPSTLLDGATKADTGGTR